MYAVIMAGGSGTRFWPISRKHRPKQFLNIFGDDPMVVETCNRLKPLVRDEAMTIVLGREHLEEAKNLLRDKKVHILGEPIGRNTAACIGLGALYSEYIGCEGPAAFLPADHFINDVAAFRKGLEEAARIAAPGKIVTLGIIPTRPETGYGYIRRAEAFANSDDIRAYHVSAFVEKPDIEKAKTYLAGGDYFWNAGIFVATPGTILEEIRRYLPGLYQGLERLQRTLGTKDFEREMETVYDELDNISFDYGVMERTDSPVLVIPCHCGWSDVGSWASLYELRSRDYDADHNLVEGETLLLDCKNNFVTERSGRLVVCIGLKNCLVIDTPDALLVAEIERSQEVRKVVEHLTGSKRVKWL
jgi:mannose-1-phosphate guanylyltransferase